MSRTPRSPSRHAAGWALASALVLLGGCSSDDDDDEGDGPSATTRWQVWASDQSNSVADASAPGTRGSYLWIWESEAVATQLDGGEAASPIGCVPTAAGADDAGPCDLLDVFPPTLAEHDADGEPTGRTLGELDGFGRLHGMLADPQNRYVNANIFAPGGGFVGVIDVRTREAVGLFRVTGTNVGGGSAVRSVHMSFWSADGSAILVANLNGKLLERIDVERDGSGAITALALDRSATLGVGQAMQVTAPATVFAGDNAFGRALLGGIEGDYAEADLGDLTPAGFCKENGCGTGPDGGLGGRPNNVIICPIVSEGDRGYVTMGGGGLLVADIASTPMRIVGEYGNRMVNGAGCGGVEAGGRMWLNAGVSASPTGATQSVFTVYAIDDGAFDTAGGEENLPEPMVVYRDAGNTASGGAEGGAAANDSGQVPGESTRRDSHGMVATIDGRFVHVVDRIANVVEVFDTDSFARSTYDLVSADGQGGGVGPCAAASADDDAALPGNDPAPDLIDRTPDGRYLVAALRGPVPVSVTHAAQGSCPGVGIVELSDDGAGGRLVGVLRSSNTLDTAEGGAPGGHAYTGAERSDVHGAVAVAVP